MFNKTITTINAKPIKCDFCPYSYLNWANVLACPSGSCRLSPKEIKSICEMLREVKKND